MGYTQVFSRAGYLADPNMDTDTLATLVSCAINGMGYKPATEDVIDKYFEMFSGKAHEDVNDVDERVTDDGNADDDAVDMSS